MTHTSAYLLGQYQTPVRGFGSRHVKIAVVLCNRCALAISLTGSVFSYSILMPYILFPCGYWRTLLIVGGF